MAQEPIQATAASGQLLDRDPRDTLDAPGDAEERMKSDDSKLVSWVISRTREWKDHRNANYEAQWNEYERLWRGIYSDSEKQRKSERSRIISPALSEAVENGVSEIEEAVFGRGDFFSLSAEARDAELEREALAKNETTFKEDLAKSDFTGQCAEAIINSAVYGTGIGEIVLTKGVDYDIVADIDTATGRPMPKVVEKEWERPTLRSVNPRNFIIDPAARGLDDALGFAIEEDVSAHLVRDGVDSGDYNKVDLEAQSGDTQTKPDPQVENPWTKDVVNVIRYYGKVPRHLLFPPSRTEELFPDDKEPESEPVSADMVEAWVVIANESKLLKAVETPDMMKDRPAVAYQWDIVPGRFWGRGICEKGVTPQKLLDAELRARIDALAFVAAPMMAMDASRLPRGFKLEVYPGKNVLLAGNPSEILKPFKFGELDQNSAAQVEMMDLMVQRATGAVDSVSLAKGGVSGEARSGAVSMAMSGIVKRNKRTLMRYVDRFLAPALRKLMWRFIQYDQTRYIPFNPSFNVSSTMGIMQREYETAGLTQILSGLQPGTSEHMLVLMALVRNSGIQDRDRVLAMMKRKFDLIQQREMQPPVDPNAQPPMDPIDAQLAQMAKQLQLAKIEAEIARLQAQARLYNAQANSELLQPQLEAQSIALKGIYNTPEEQMNEEFNRRMKAAQLMVDREEIASNERIADKQIIAAQVNQPLAEAAPAPERKPSFVDEFVKTQAEIAKMQAMVVRMLAAPKETQIVTDDQGRPIGTRSRIVSDNTE